MFTLPPLSRQSDATVYGSKTDNDGVFDNIEDVIEMIYQTRRDYAVNYKAYDRQRITEAIRRTARDYVEVICRMIVGETKMGRYENKLEKHLVVIDKTPGPDCLNTEVISGDEGLVSEEYASFGVIVATTPITGPTETVINNTISTVVGGSAAVFNVHPTAK